jgi:peptidyl-tRNA hydrolase, PTH2 family
MELGKQYQHILCKRRYQGGKESSSTKMVIVMRKDLQMTKRKYVAQGSHASLGVVKWIEYNGTEIKEILNKWFDETFVKVTVYVESLDELYTIYHLAKEKELPVRLITDNGLTMFNGVKTNTCLAILGERESG